MPKERGSVGLLLRVLFEVPVVLFLFFRLRLGLRFRFGLGVRLLDILLDGIGVAVGEVERDIAIGFRLGFGFGAVRW